MKKNKNSNIVAVVVTYQPDQQQLLSLITAIIPQVDAVIVVDNGSDSEIKKSLPKSSSYLGLDANYGIAVAQNKGIKWAKEKQATHVILCDQDSVPRHDMVEKLLYAEKQAINEGIMVGAVGVRYHDPINNSLSGYVGFGFMHFTQISCEADLKFVKCGFLIASGCLIRMECLDNVGNMDEQLFIDHVDTDWCLRAQSLGYDIIGACNAIMQHDLGEARVEVNFLNRRRQISVHQPYRQYYVFRNSVLIYRKEYSSWKWIGGDITRLVQRFVFFGLLQGPRRKNIKMMLRGLSDGIRGRSGRLRL